MDRWMDEKKGKTHHNITFTVAFSQGRIASIAHNCFFLLSFSTVYNDIMLV